MENQLAADRPPLKFTWKIDNFSKLIGNKHYSETFSGGGYKWRVLIFPKGDEDADHLSLHLDVANSSSLPFGWSRYSKFRLSVVGQRDANYTKTRECTHEFNALERVWGFPSFMPLSKLHDLSRGYLGNDTCIIQAEVDVHKEMVSQLEAMEGTNEAKDQPSIDVNWANDTAGGMMSAALKNLRDDHLSYKGFSAMTEALRKSFIGLGAIQLFEDTWRPWIDEILQTLKELDNMEEALKMHSIEAALKESLLKINESCQLQEVSYSKLESEEELEEHAVRVCRELIVTNEAKLTELKTESQMYEALVEQYEKEVAEKEHRLKKWGAALLSAKSALEGLKAQKAKIEGQLEDLQAQVADRRKTLMEKKAEIRLRMQIHPTQPPRKP